MILGILSKTLALNNVQSYCIQLIGFAIQQLRHMPDGLKNLGASSFRHFGKGERLRGTRASEKCIVTKNAQQISKIETLFVPNPAHLQWAQDQGGRLGFCSGKKSPGESESDTYWIMHESHISCDTTGLLRTYKLRPSPFFKLL